MPSIGWFEDFATSDRDIGLGIVTADGQAELIADKDAFSSPYSQQTVFKVLVHQDEYWAFANSYMPRSKEGGVLFFNIWRSADGRSWTNQTPAYEGIPDYTNMNDVVIGSKGFIAAGWQADRDEEGGEYYKTLTPIVLFSADGTNWTAVPIGQDKQTDLKVAAAGSTYYAYDEEAHIWFSTDGLTWDEASSLNFKRLNADKEWVEDLASSRSISKFLSFPGGLIALSGSRFSKGTRLLFSGDLPFDYLNQR